MTSGPSVKGLGTATRVKNKSARTACATSCKCKRGLVNRVLLTCRLIAFTDLSCLKAMYREIRSHVRRNDVRIRQRVSEKYGCKQREKVKQILHHASKQIVLDAKRREFGIVMEKLTGIRKLYRKGNWQGRGYRGRMNAWSFTELQRQIEYKARWQGIPVIYVNPSGTSVTCS